jgi:cytochrome c peroxidase
MASSQPGQTLSEEEVASFEAFLLSLTGEQPHVVYPILPPGTVDTPRPVL